MILTGIFLITMMVTMLNVVKLLSIICGNSIVLPFDGTIFQFGHGAWMYPSFLFQIWFWFSHFGILPL